MSAIPCIEELNGPLVNGYDQDSLSVYKKTTFSTKIFCDPVHGQITFHPVCVAIIDTPQFQRLRHIKQTGFTEYVYPGSSHNRFGHSLGVCYLAGKFLQELKERQPELQLTDIDILCVQLAGLCHDLGHGPFSHTWEVYMKIANRQRGYKESWKHEYASANMLDYLIEENDLQQVLAEHGIGPQEISLVKDYIRGVQPMNSSKAFLHQIVNNDDSGLDVDKWDYFLRDCWHLGLPCSFQYERLMQYAKVFYVDGRTQICFRDKVLESVYNCFRTRSNLHRLAYQHKVAIIIEKMFIDAMLMADDKLIGPSSELLHCWEWSRNAAYGNGDELSTCLKKFYMLTDELLLTCLKFTPIPELRRASQIIKAIDNRSFRNSEMYQHVGLKILSQYRSEELILNGICAFLPTANVMTFPNHHMETKPIEPVSSDDIYVCVLSVNWGKGSQNPVEFVHFYCKDNTFMKKSVDQLEVSVMLPKSYEEIQVHVLCRRSDSFALQVTRWCFDMYWKCSGRESHL